jgi:hypothetical protein
MDGFFTVLQFLPPGHLINYLVMLIAKLIVWPRMTMLHLMYTNLKIIFQKNLQINIKKVNHSFKNDDFL